MVDCIVCLIYKLKEAADLNKPTHQHMAVYAIENSGCSDRICKAPDLLDYNARPPLHNHVYKAYLHTKKSSWTALQNTIHRLNINEFSSHAPSMQQYAIH
jgi:hypothetical protein